MAWRDDVNLKLSACAPASGCAHACEKLRSTVLKRLTILSSAVVTLGIAALAVMLVLNPIRAANASPRAGAGASGGMEVLHNAIIMPVRGALRAAATSSNLYYHGGTSDGTSGTVGVETGSDSVYLIYWGSAWGGVNSSTGCPTSDASNECGIEKAFFGDVGGGQWNGSQTQYCEGVASGTTFCNGAGTAVANPAGVLKGVWVDLSSAPNHPTQSALANEAIRAAAQFGNTTTASNTTVQYVIDTASGHNASGFGTRYCAWHSSTTSSYGDVAYTNMPYITDAGASCGANFVNSGSGGATDGITIVGGHEFAETETDIYPNGGWLDSGGSETGDKCAWISSGQGAGANVNLQTGTISGSNTENDSTVFPVQSLWSNIFNNNAGGCVQ